jgi:hypothetical protein
MARLDASTARPGSPMTFQRIRNYAGLAAAIVPLAIVVHLAAEAAATGREGITLGFVARHAYFGVFFGAAACWFGATVGLGRSPAERRRRCALLRVELGGARRFPHLAKLVGANLAFFAVTQAVEGAPIASGALAIGLTVALAGSLLAALLAFAFGDSIVAVGLDSVIASAPLRRNVAPCRGPDRAIAIPRHASSDYSLFIPNRPPPIASQL